MVLSRHILFVLFFLSFFIGAAGQEMHFENIARELGLPALECYNVTQDRKGYIWIATEAGMCRYDGSELKIFDGRNGLPEGAVYAVMETPDSTLWMLTSDKRLLYYRNDSLHEEKVLTRYFHTVHKPLDILYLLSKDEHGYIYINSVYNTLKVDPRTRRWTEVGLPGRPGGDIFIFMKTGNGLIPVSNGEQDVLDGKVRIVIRHEGGQTRLVFPYKGKVTPKFQVYAVRAGGTDFFSYENYVVRLHPDMGCTVYEYPGRVLTLYADPQNGLWVGCLKGGVYYYPDPDRMETYRYVLPEYSVSGICEDSEKNIWATTLEKGVFLCRNKNILYYSSIPGLDHAVDMLKNESGRIFVSGSGIPLGELTPQRVTKHGMGSGTWFLDMVKYPGGWIMAEQYVLLKTDARFRSAVRIRSHQFPVHSSPVVVTHAGGDRLVGIHPTNVSEVTPDSLYLHHKKMQARLRTVFYAGNDTICLGTAKGIFWLAYPLSGNPERVPGLDAAVNKIIRLRSGPLCVATKNGLYVIRNRAALRVDKALGISTGIFFDIAQDRYGTLWLGSNLGLVKITESGGRYRVQVYSSRNGLPVSDVYKVAVDDENIYLSTSGGVCTFPLTEELANTRRPPVYVDRVWVNGRFVDHRSGTPDFAHDENSFRITVDAPVFKSFGTQLLYELKGTGGGIQKNEGNTILLDNLPPGEYELWIDALNNDGLKSDRPAVLRFGIRSPFWQRTWFIGLCVLSFLAAVYIVFRRSVKAVKRREEEKNRIHRLVSESKLSALQAQMNPHFIFNAINSIQNYILKKKEQDAYDYLAKFGRLIRTVLNHSLQKNLALYQELDTIKLYVELEQLRFKNAFEFRVQVHETVNIYETYVPAMLIQPYVENAIWHGLMKLDNKRKGVLLLDICIEGDRLKVTVEDNGVGRARAAEGRRDDFHLPVAAVLTEQRLAIINNMQGYETTHISVVDLFDAEGNACGTRVEIWVPVNHF